MEAPPLIKLSPIESVVCDAVVKLTSDLNRMFKGEEKDTVIKNIGGGDANRQYCMFTGGWIRDKLFNCASKDIDIVVSSDVFEIFTHRMHMAINLIADKDKMLREEFDEVRADIILDIKLKTGTCVGLRLLSIEISMWGIDGEVQKLILDLREMRRNHTIEDDVKTRDFTMNGIYFSPYSRLVLDICRGLEDIQKKVIRTIDGVSKTFEDVRRYLRVIRFKNSKTLEYEPDIQSRLINNASSSLKNYPKKYELIREFGKLMSDDGYWIDSISDAIRYDLIWGVSCLSYERDGLIEFFKAAMKDSKTVEDKVLALNRRHLKERIQIRAYMVSFILAIWSKKTLDRDTLISGFSNLYEILRYLVRIDGKDHVQELKSNIQGLYKKKDPSIQLILDCCFIEFKSYVPPPPPPAPKIISKQKSVDSWDSDDDWKYSRGKYADYYSPPSPSPYEGNGLYHGMDWEDYRDHYNLD